MVGLILLSHFSHWLGFPSRAVLFRRNFQCNSFIAISGSQIFSHLWFFFCSFRVRIHNLKFEQYSLKYSSLPWGFCVFDHLLFVCVYVIFYNFLQGYCWPGTVPYTKYQLLPWCTRLCSRVWHHKSQEFSKYNSLDEWHIWGKYICQWLIA